ncbi:MAG: hypothetical protein ISR34_12000 [Pirellulales bacterium]|nr:hypothetical protein [Pirellulales bacterium]|tara:strand:+ start:11998 stop:12330 length:333 start_codon:yes stop_codon:yes gene_type:complete
MTYSWTIVSLETIDQVNGEGVTLSNAVVKIHWVKTGTADNSSKGSVVGFHKLTAASVGEADFVSFSDLTEATVIGWLEAGIPTELMDSYNTAIQDKIDSQGASPRAIPWS